MDFMIIIEEVCLNCFYNNMNPCLSIFISIIIIKFIVIRERSIWNNEDTISIKSFCFNIGFLLLNILNYSYTKCKKESFKIWTCVSYPLQQRGKEISSSSFVIITSIHIKPNIFKYIMYYVQLKILEEVILKRLFQGMVSNHL